MMGNGVFLTVFGTVVSGVAVLVIGQVIRTLVLEPMKEQRRAIGEIDYTLLYTARWWGNPVDAVHVKDFPEQTRQAMWQAEDGLRQCASRLAATTNVIFGYSKLAWMGWVPARDSVDKARSLLIGVSNSVFAPVERGVRNIDQVREIRRLLLLPPSPPGMSI
jgi:hypothetical protein